MRRTESKSVTWAKGKTYHFYYDAEDCISRGDKTIRRGWFEGETPSSAIRPHQRCVLITIHLSGNRDYNSIPQMRLHNDFLNYPNKPHLRKILSWDANAKTVRDRVSHDSYPLEDESSLTCHMIQPEYQDSKKAMLDSTAYERLELLLQTIAGIQELQSYYLEKNKENGCKENIAHRDIKLPNILIERGKERFTAVLIDFASLRVRQLDKTFTAMLYPMSHVNTAPEGVDVSVRKRYDVTEKSDVFALGGLIGELFGNCNPLGYWTTMQEDKAGDVAHRVEDVGKIFAKAYQSLFPLEEQRTPGDSWLESELGDKFFWRVPDGMPSDAKRRLQRIFFQATRISPSDRLSLDELRQELYDFQRDCEQRRNLDNPFLYDKDASPETDSRYILEDDEEEDEDDDAERQYVCLLDMSDMERARDYVRALRDDFPQNAPYAAYMYFPFVPGERSLAMGTFDNRDALCAQIEDAIQRGMTPYSRSPVSPIGDSLIRALVAAVRRLTDGKTTQSGRTSASLAIFTPQLPEDEQCVPCDGISTKAEAIKRFQRRCQRAEAFVYSDRKPSLEEAEKDSWYEWNPLRPASAPTPPQRREPSPRSLYSHANDAPYVYWGGQPLRKAYVGKQKS